MQEEHDALVAEVEPELNLRRYQAGHWDNVAKLYREIEKRNWVWVTRKNCCSSYQSEESQRIFEKVKNLDEIEKSKTWGNYVHVLDVKKEGEIGHHIDNTEVGT